jgi:hypothetical protein
MHKLSRQLNGEWVEHVHQPEFREHENKLIIALSGEGTPFISGIVKLMDEPLFILYVLHTSRGEGQEGRYQSPSLSQAEVGSLLDEYSELLTFDSRFDIWFYSPCTGLPAALCWYWPIRWRAR